MEPSDATLQPLPDALPLPTRPLVAVLPFAPGGDDPAMSMLGSELADRLRERLAADPAVQAILISSEFLSKAPAHALDLICRELRVGHLISGTCHATGGEPSLYVELSDTRDWHIRWADFYRGGARSFLSEDGVALAGLVADLRRALVPLPRR